MSRKPILIYKGNPSGFGQKESIHYWQSRPATERLRAIWDLVEIAWKMKGRNLNELRFQRSVAVLKRI